MPARRPPPIEQLDPAVRFRADAARGPDRAAHPDPAVAGPSGPRPGADALPPRRRRTTLPEDGRRQLDLVGVLADLGTLDEADRRERDVEDVELLGQRLDDAAEAVVAAVDERLAQVRPQELEPALAQVRDRRQARDLELRPRRLPRCCAAAGARAARPA